MNQVVILEFLNMGGGEIMLILGVVLLLFGGKKLPELARGLGKGIREFKDASEGVKREIHRNINAVNAEDEPVDINNDRHHPVATEGELVHTTAEVHDPTVLPPENQAPPEEVQIDQLEKAEPEQTKK